MKISVSLPDEDLVVIDEYAKTSGLRTRSAVIHQAIRTLRNRDLTEEYRQAFEEWNASPDAELWGSTVGDGIETDEPFDAPR